MIGIYKITSPTGKIYIGQSINIELRLKNYLSFKTSIKVQIRLYNSLMKHGVDSHSFDIIETCDVSLLNEKERYWQEFYNTIGENGLNCRLTTTNEKSGEMSSYSKLKMSLSKKGKKKTKEHIEKIRQASIGKKLSQETKDKIRKNHSHSKPMLGKKLTKETKYKLSLNGSKNKIVLDFNTGVYYNSLANLCDLYGYNKMAMSRRLSGRYKNKTQYKYV